MAGFWVSGIVARRDKQAYIQLSNENGLIAQLTLGQARQIAQDIIQMAARTEMDAMILQFFDEEMQAPLQMGEKAMTWFREYRARVDQEQVMHRTDDPDAPQEKS